MGVGEKANAKKNVNLQCFQPVMAFVKIRERRTTSATQFLFSAESQCVDNTGSGALCGGQPFGLQQAADLLLRVALVLLVPQHVQQRQPQAVELLRLRALQQTDQLGVVGLVVLGRAPGRSYHCKKWFAIGLAKPLANLGKE